MWLLNSQTNMPLLSPILRRVWFLGALGLGALAAAPITAPITGRPPSVHVPQISSAVAQLGQSTSASQTLLGITFTVKTSVTGVLAYELAKSAPQLATDWNLTSDTPAICSITGGRVTKLSSGLGVVRATGPDGFAKLMTLDFWGSTAISEVWTGFSGVSKSSKLSDPTLALLSPGKDKNYFLPGTSTKNPNCWAAPLDLTGSAIRTSLWGELPTGNSGALITPQHWVGVAHWGAGDGNMGPGSQLQFVGSDGVTHTRTVLRRDYNEAKDRIVSLLDSPLPTTVRPFKLAGTSMRDAGTRQFYGMGWQISQEKNISPVSFDACYLNYYQPLSPQIIWRSSWINMDDPTHILYGREALLQRGRGGDSGGAVGGYYNGETYLVSLFSGVSNGLLYTAAQAPELNAIIAALDAAVGISTGYTVGVLEVN